MIRFARGLWGMPGNDVVAQCAAIREAGFDAVEACLGDEDSAVEDLVGAAKAAGLGWIAQIHTRRSAGSQADVRLARDYRLAARMGASLVNLHTGCDLMPDEANDRLFERAGQLAAETGVPCVHETHRGRATWSVPATERLIQRHPNLRFCADLSHWCCVHESLLERSAEVVAQVLERSDLVHARIGHAEGPQVADWRDPRCARELAAHLAWWDAAVAQARRESRALTICLEFGGSPYQPCEPFTGLPLSDGWEVNLTLMQKLRSRYSRAEADPIPQTRTPLP
jgi:hypothetical protein